MSGESLNVIEQKDYFVIDCVQGLYWGLDLGRALFEETHRGGVEFVYAVVEHGILVKILCFHPLQRNSLRWTLFRVLKVYRPFDLEAEAVPDVPGGVDLDTLGCAAL